MEVNGDMSFLPKAQYKPITQLDMDITSDKSELLANVIIDGKIMHTNLHLMNKDEQWLDNKLKKEGIDDIKKIILCTLDKNEKVTIYQNNTKVKSLDILE